MNGAAAANRSSAIAVQSVAMPQAGGGIQGLGDHHRADGFSGEFSFEVPLQASPCRGFEPSLELRYASFAGNGTFGQGADVGISSIARQTSQAIPLYDDTDVFLLDGEQLTPVADGAKSRTVGGTTYAVTPFRPRVDEAFDRIERWTSDPLDVFWRVLVRDGSVLVYGRSEDARVADPDDPTRVAEWLLETALDPRGDVRSYTYKQENATGLPATLSEQGRSQTANRYIERICYGNDAAYASPDGGVTPLPGQDWHFELVFDYGEYDVGPENDDPYTAVSAWSSRPDPFSSYRFGFERRTHRLCRNVLMFHRFAEELGPDPVLVHALALDYAEDPRGTTLASCTLVGYRYYASQPSGQRYVARALPSLETSFGAFDPDSNVGAAPLRDVTGSAVEGFDGVGGYALVDLYGDGVPGILYADGGSVSYRAPVAAGPAPALSWSARAPLDRFPIERAAGGDGIALRDLGGDGVLDVLRVAGATGGFYRAVRTAEWAPFTPFPADLPVLFDDAYQNADLDGDGHADRVWASAGNVGYFASLGEAGFAAARVVPAEPTMPPTLGAAPSLDRHQLIAFADPLGGGTPCLVRVTSGAVECWPSLGHGRFAPVVRMTGAPTCDDEFDATRVFFADVDGSGADSLAFAYADRVEVFPNLCGNGFATTPVIIPLPAPFSQRSQIAVADLYGNGYECLVFSTHDPEPQAWAIDLCGGAKPYLLQTVDEGQGMTTAVGYRSCAWDRLADARAGLDWITRVPFPLQVVAVVTETDGVSGVSTTTSLRYHHGHYDHLERAFRGFGYVEEADVATATLEAGGTDPCCPPPLLTRSWFHTGAWQDQSELAAAYRAEQFTGDARAWPSPPPTFDLGAATADAETARQAAVALAGRVLREERYGLDGSAQAAVPYDVEESGWHARMLQPASAAGYASFLVYEEKAVEAVYERDPHDPRVQQRFTFAVDDYGDVALECLVACARRPGAADMAAGQDQPRVVATECSWDGITSEPDAWLLGELSEHKVSEITGFPAADLDGLYWSFAAMQSAVTAAVGGEASGPVANVARWSQNDYAAPANGGTITLQALVVRRRQAVFADAVATSTFAGQPIAATLATTLTDVCGYVLESGYWWNPGWTAAYGDATAFYRVAGASDPLASQTGTIAEYAYDAHALLLQEVTLRSSGADVLPHSCTVTENDYVALAPARIEDPNGTCHEALRDPLGVTVAVSSHGTEWVDGQAAAVGFSRLDLGTPPATADSLEVLLATPEAYLGGAAAVVFYDLGGWRTSGTAPVVATLTATAYPDHDLPGGAIEVSIAYGDGAGREVQRTELAEPGPVANVQTSPRWRTASRSRYNEKGLPFLVFAASFAGEPDFVPAENLGEDAVTTTLQYDALDRVVRVDTAAGSFAQAFFSTVDITSWSTVGCDRDDTVTDSPYYQYYVTDGNAGLSRWDLDALAKAATVAATPGVAAVDPLGHLAEVRRLLTPTGQPLIETRAADVMGQEAWAADARLGPDGVKNVERTYTLTGETLSVASVDAGELWALHNAVGNIVYRYGSRGFELTTSYDGLQRPIAVSVSGGDGGRPVAAVVTRYVYGDSLDATGQPPVESPADHNLLGEQWRRYDGAGLVEQGGFSITGMATTITTCPPTAYDAAPDWALDDPPAGWVARLAILDASLDAPQTRTATYDALGRVVQLVDESGNARAFAFHVSGLLDTITWTPAAGQARAYVTGTQYNAAGQVLLVTFGDASGDPVIAAQSTYDPRTTRLLQLMTTRVADAAVLQDLTYHYDPAANVTHVENAAPLGATGVSADTDYSFDSLYRLVASRGRALTGYAQADERGATYDPFFVDADPAAETYTCTYGYDEGDNLTSIAYVSDSAQWSTPLDIASGSNRLVGQFDAAGNALTVDGIDSIAWAYDDRIQSMVIDGTTQYLLHDDAGHRVAKILVSGSGPTEVVERTLYLPGLQRYSRTVGGIVQEEVDRARVAAPGGTCGWELQWRQGTPPAGQATSWFELTDLIGSAMVAADDTGVLLHGEEFLPFGGTTYAWSAEGEPGIVLKPTRHAGRERDATSGLYDYGLRAYACWLGRWISADPALDADGLNLYAFCGNNPVTFVDPRGLGKKGPKKGGKSKAATEKPKGVSKTKKKAPAAAPDVRFEKVGIRSSKLRHLRRVQTKDPGTRNIGVFKLVPKDTTKSKKPLYLVGRSLGQGVTEIVLRDEMVMTTYNTPKRRSHTEAILRAVYDAGSVTVGGQTFNFADYEIEYFAETNAPCRSAPGRENCRGRFGKTGLLGTLIYYSNEYSGHKDADRFKKAVARHNELKLDTESGYLSDTASESESTADEVMVDVVPGTDFKSKTVDLNAAITATWLRDFKAAGKS